MVKRNGCIDYLKFEAAVASLSKALASFSKPTVLTLHSAITNIPVLGVFNS